MADVLLTHSNHVYFDRKQVEKMQQYVALRKEEFQLIQDLLLNETTETKMQLNDVRSKIQKLLNE